VEFKIENPGVRGQRNLLHRDNAKNDGQRSNNRHNNWSACRVSSHYNCTKASPATARTMDLSVGVGAKVEVPSVGPLDLALDPLHIVRVDDGSCTVRVLWGHCGVHGSRWVAGRQFGALALHEQIDETRSKTAATHELCRSKLSRRPNSSKLTFHSPSATLCCTDTGSTSNPTIREPLYESASATGTQKAPNNTEKRREPKCQRRARKLLYCCVYQPECTNTRKRTWLKM